LAVRAEREGPQSFQGNSETDITKIDKIRSVNLTLFGIALGDATNAAQEKVRAAGFRPEVAQAVGIDFIRVFDSSNKEIFGITDEGGKVARLTLRDDLALLLPGEWSKLFSLAHRSGNRSRSSVSDCLGARIVARWNIPEAPR
jgi:hypothetical protein